MSNDELTKCTLSKLQHQFPNAYNSFIDIINHFEIDVEEFELWTVLDSKYLVAEHAACGPREPSLVWTGQRWICSEDNLTADEEAIMDEVAAECPGGLGGWN